MVKELFRIHLGDRGGRNRGRGGVTTPPFTPEAAEKFACAARVSEQAAQLRAAKQQSEIDRLTKELASANQRTQASDTGSGGELSFAEAPARSREFAEALAEGEAIAAKELLQEQLEEDADWKRNLHERDDAAQHTIGVCMARVNDLYCILSPLLVKLESGGMSSAEVASVISDFNESTNEHEQRQAAHNDEYPCVHLDLN
jgi:hypothetical protein